MANEATTTDGAGIARTSDGTIAPTPATEGSPQNTTPPNQTQTPPSTDGKTVLNQETKPDATSKDDGATGDKKPDAKTDGAPEKYEAFTVPEGATLDPKAVEKATSIFKELGLNQANAQKLVDVYNELAAEAAAAPRKAYLDMTDGWLKEAQDHPDLRGKLGPGQEVNVRIAKLLDGVGDQKLASDFRAAMDLTGVGNHPAFIRLMDHFAKQLTEGTHVAGNGPSPGGQSRPGTDTRPGAAAAMWPTLPSATQGR